MARNAVSSVIRRLSIIKSRFGTWLVHGRPLWTWLLIVMALFVTPHILRHIVGYPGSAEGAVRLSGVFLQAAGLIAVVHDLNGVVKELGGVSVWSAASAYVTEFLKIFEPPRTIFGSANITLGPMTMSAHGTVGHANSTGTIEDRVKNLEDRMGRQEQEVQRVHKVLIDEGDALRKLLDQERKDREESERNLIDRMKGAVIGKVHLKVGSFAYLLVGTILGTAPLN